MKYIDNQWVSDSYIIYLYYINNNNNFIFIYFKVIYMLFIQQFINLLKFKVKI